MYPMNTSYMGVSENSVPLNPMVLLIIIPFLNGYFIGNISYFQTNPYGSVSKPCTPVVHIKIAGKWMFIPLKMVLKGIDPYPYIP